MCLPAIKSIIENYVICLWYWELREDIEEARVIPYGMSMEEIMDMWLK